MPTFLEYMPTFSKNMPTFLEKMSIFLEDMPNRLKNKASILTVTADISHQAGSSIAASSEGEPMDPAALIMLLTTMPRTQTKFDITRAKEAKIAQERSEREAFAAIPGEYRVVTGGTIGSLLFFDIEDGQMSLNGYDLDSDGLNCQFINFKAPISKEEKGWVARYANKACNLNFRFAPTIYGSEVAISKKGDCSSICAPSSV